MTKPDNFLQRWSKRKLARGDETAPQREERSEQAGSKNEAAALLAQDVATTGEEKPFDLSSLPSIESIDANTDVTAFLRPEVPPELSRAALRRAWTADPAIRDFVGLVENGWDFNDPHAMAGFGPIDAGEVARLAGQIIGELPAPAGIGGQEVIDRRGQGDSQPQIAEQVENHTSEETKREQDQHTDAPRNAENDAAHKEPRD
jgi:hypothetical protein